MPGAEPAMRRCLVKQCCIILDVDAVVDMNTAVIFTANDQSKPGSWMAIVFGDPNDYVWKQDLSSNSGNPVIGGRYLTNRRHDSFHAVAIDSHTPRIFYSNNALGWLAYTRYIVDSNDTSYQSYLDPPITKVVILAVVSLFIG